MTSNAKKAYAKEFCSAGFIGVIAALCALRLRPDSVPVAVHFATAFVVTGFYSCILLNPGCFLIVLAVFTAPIAYTLHLKPGIQGYIGYAWCLLNLLYLAWALFETARHAHRVQTDAAYRNRFDAHSREFQDRVFRDPRL